MHRLFVMYGCMHVWMRSYLSTIIDDDAYRTPPPRQRSSSSLESHEGASCYLLFRVTTSNGARQLADVVSSLCLCLSLSLSLSLCLGGVAAIPPRAYWRPPSINRRSMHDGRVDGWVLVRREGGSVSRI
eukprot:GHVU01229984.1.p1 GENE.GHVU01229984.1~~GHVU01229984.1.p1  ORF type:complete len:129 (+),score=5.61 GHVU01229984.1:93-479(+)